MNITASARRTLLRTLPLLMALALLALCALPTRSAHAQATAQRAEAGTPDDGLDGYDNAPASRDGIGKRYLGREIARVMGHQAAGWLERPERVQEERPDTLMAELGLQPGMSVADLGAGSGYHTTRLARAVSPGGLVWAIDVQPQMLALVDTAMRNAGLGGYRSVLATPTDPGLPPASVDLVLMVDVYHELEYPREVLRALVRALRPGGRIAFVEYKAEDPSIPIKSLHMMSEAQIRREAQSVGLRWQRTYRGLPWQHLVIFEGPPAR